MAAKKKNSQAAFSGLITKVPAMPDGYQSAQAPQYPDRLTEYAGYSKEFKNSGQYLLRPQTKFTYFDSIYANANSTTYITRTNVLTHDLILTGIFVSYRYAGVNFISVTLEDEDTGTDLLRFYIYPAVQSFYVDFQKNPLKVTGRIRTIVSIIVTGMTSFVQEQLNVFYYGYEEPKFV
jgi:type IV secretory pathway VirB6-like protein